MLVYAAAGVCDAHDSFVIGPCQFDLYSAAFRRELNGVVDKVSDRLKQQITVATHGRPVFQINQQVDLLVLRNGFVDITHLPQQFVHLDAAEGNRTPAVLDFSETKQCRNDTQRLINVCDRLVRNRLQLLQRGSVGAASFESKPHPRQRRSQVVGDVITHPGQRVDHRFHLVQHTVHDSRKLRKRLVEVSVWKPLP